MTTTHDAQFQTATAAVLTRAAARMVELAAQVEKAYTDPDTGCDDFGWLLGDPEVQAAIQGAERLLDAGASDHPITSAAWVCHVTCDYPVTGYHARRGGTVLCGTNKINQR